MKRNHFLSAVLIMLISVTACAAETEGFVPLFNGRTLDGWVNVNCGPSTWTVSNNMIVCTGIPTGLLRTDKQYENYILDLEWRHMKKGGNSGLFIHSDPLPATGSPFSRAIEVQVREGDEGSIFPINGAFMTPPMPNPTGSNHALPNEPRMKAQGEWNHYRVVSKDGTVSLEVNGSLVTHGYHLNPRKGYICLESEGSEIHFRNIQIKELPSSNPHPDVVAEVDKGFRSLYNGIDLSGWKQVSGNAGHWQPNNWILEYDGKSEAEGEDKHLTSAHSYKDFSLIVDWRQNATPKFVNVPVILPDGSQAKDTNGNPVNAVVLDAGDSGIYLRGSSAYQANIWNWPVGSGEMYTLRVSSEYPPEIRRAATPILNADNPVGEWNRFEITVRRDTITTILNGKTVIPESHFPGIPDEGPIKLQHHGDTIQFANIYIKELD